MKVLPLRHNRAYGKKKGEAAKLLRSSGASMSEQYVTTSYKLAVAVLEKNIYDRKLPNSYPAPQ